MARTASGGRRRATCLECGKHRDQVGEISRKGYCSRCGQGRLVENLAQLQLQRGPHWEAFVRGMQRRRRYPMQPDEGSDQQAH